MSSISTARRCGTSSGIPATRILSGEVWAFAPPPGIANSGVQDPCCAKAYACSTTAAPPHIQLTTRPTLMSPPHVPGGRPVVAFATDRKPPCCLVRRETTVRLPTMAGRVRWGGRGLGASGSSRQREVYPRDEWEMRVEFEPSFYQARTRLPPG